MASRTSMNDLDLYRKLLYFLPLQCHFVQDEHPKTGFAVTCKWVPFSLTVQPWLWHNFYFCPLSSLDQTIHSQDRIKLQWPSCFHPEHSVSTAPPPHTKKNCHPLYFLLCPALYYRNQIRGNIDFFSTTCTLIDPDTSKKRVLCSCLRKLSNLVLFSA